jgi:hypothetical protein
MFQIHIHKISFRGPGKYLLEKIDFLGVLVRMFVIIQPIPKPWYVYHTVQNTF